MDKAQAIHQFWSSFGLPAYDANTVDPNAEMPYITYDVASGALDEPLNLTASLWYHSTSWKEISQKAELISFVTRSHIPIAISGGYLWVTEGRPFAQRMSDPDDMVRRIVINITAEFLTAY